VTAKTLGQGQHRARTTQAYDTENAQAGLMTWHAPSSAECDSPGQKSAFPCQQGGKRL